MATAAVVPLLLMAVVWVPSGLGEKQSKEATWL